MSDMNEYGEREGYVKPDRGVLVLVLGILGLVFCPICGIVAWVMGNGDLQEMQAGRMNREGEGLTTAGRILGIISSVLLVLWVVVFVIVMVVVVGGAAASR